MGALSFATNLHLYETLNNDQRSNHHASTAETQAIPRKRPQTAGFSGMSPKDDSPDSTFGLTECIKAVRSETDVPREPVRIWFEESRLGLSKRGELPKPSHPKARNLLN